MRSFRYLQPKSVEEAISMLQSYGQEAKLIAGGTDLLIQMEKKGLSYSYLVGLNRVEGLSYIRDDPRQNVVRIGSMTLIQDIADSPLMEDRFHFLAEACRQLGSIQVRNIATLGGNLCNAAPSAEAAPPLLCLDARGVAMGPEGKRLFPVEELFRGPGQTSLARDEVLLEVEIPYAGEGTGGIYQKLAHRRAVDIAVVNVAISMKRGPGDSCELMKLALGAVAPVPLRIRTAENMVLGQEMTDALIQKVAERAAGEASPISDVRGTAEYRREMVKVLVSGGIKEIWKRLGSC